MVQHKLIQVARASKCMCTYGRWFPLFVSVNLSLDIHVSSAIYIYIYIFRGLRPEAGNAGSRGDLSHIR